MFPRGPSSAEMDPIDAETPLSFRVLIRSVLVHILVLADVELQLLFSQAHSVDWNLEQ